MGEGALSRLVYPFRELLLLSVNIKYNPVEFFVSCLLKVKFVFCGVVSIFYVVSCNVI